MEHVSKRFGDFYANRDINLSVRKGEVHTLLGENGAGKSTLMNVLIGLYQPTEGKIFLNGKEVRIDSPAQAVKLGIGMVHQHFMLVDSLRVYENVILGMEPKNGIMIDKEKAIRAVKETAKKYNLKIDPMAVVGELSVSQKQKVEILKVLLRGAKLLILDEPTAQLDPAARKDFLVMLQKLHKEFGLTIILTSHNLEDVMEMSDECVILDDGKVIEQGKSERGCKTSSKNTSSIGTISATDSSAGREISDRTDFFRWKR